MGYQNGGKRDGHQNCGRGERSGAPELGGGGGGGGGRWWRGREGWIRKSVHRFTSILCMFAGAGTFGTVRAGIYRPKNRGPEVECAIKVLKPADECPNQKVNGK